MRITKEVLSVKVNNLNNAMHLDDSNKFVLNYAYSGVALEQRTNSAGGTRRISERTTNATMAVILDSIENVIYSNLK